MENPVDYSPMRRIGSLFIGKSNPIKEMEDMDKNRKKYQHYYYVEYIDGAEWVRKSKHINPIAATANFEVLAESGKHARIIYQGKIINERKPEEKPAKR